MLFIGSVLIRHGSVDINPSKRVVFGLIVHLTTGFSEDNLLQRSTTGYSGTDYVFCKPSIPFI